MHPNFSQSVVYMVCKQEKCVSDIINVEPANHFPISCNMGSSDIVASWFLKRHGPWVIWIWHPMPFNHSKDHFKLYPSDMVFFHSYAFHLRSDNPLSLLMG